jgi:hypothetical protein
MKTNDAHLYPTPSTFKRTVIYSFCMIMITQTISLAFTSVPAMAQEYEIIDGQLVVAELDPNVKFDAMQGGAFDGAVGISSFTLPELSQANGSPGFNPTGLSQDDASYYTDDSKQHLNNSVHLEQLIPSYDAAEFDNYLTELDDLSTDPHLIIAKQQAMWLDAQTYKDADCMLLATDEAEKCLRAQAAASILHLQDNVGADEFAGKDDPILDSFAAIADGEHPYFQELYDEQCEEVVTSATTDPHSVKKGKQHCTVFTEPGQLQCRAERFVRSYKVDEKPVLWTTTFDDLQVVHSDWASSAKGGQGKFHMTSCDEGTYDFDESCVKLNFMTVGNIVPTDKVISGFANYNAAYPDSVSYGETDMAHIKSITFKLGDDMVHKRTAMSVSKTLLYAEGESVPSIEALDPHFNSNYVDTSDRLAVEAGRFFIGDVGSLYYTKPVALFSECPHDVPLRSKSIYIAPEGSTYSGAKPYCDKSDLPLYHNDFTGYNEDIGHILSFSGAENYFNIHSAIPRNLNLNAFYQTPPTSECGKRIEVPAGTTGAYKGPDGLWNIDLPPCTGGAVAWEYNQKGQFVNLTSFQMVFHNPELIVGQVTDVETVSVKFNVLIDQPDDYPKPSTLDIHSQRMSVNYDVFPNNVYSLSEYFPTNLRVIGQDAPQYVSRVCDFNEYDLVDTAKMPTGVIVPRSSFPLLDGRYPTVNDNIHSSYEPYRCMVPYSDATDLVGWKPTAQISRCPEGYGFDPENLLGNCLTTLPPGTSNIKNYELINIGRNDNRYTYHLDIDFYTAGNFHVMADLHKIEETGFRPMEGELPECQQTIDLYVSGTIPADATCDAEIVGTTERVFDSGVLIDEPHQGYVYFMPSWGEASDPPLNQTCWEATIEVDQDEIIGLAGEGRELICQSFEGQEYQDCLDGQICYYNMFTGGDSCFSMSNLGSKDGFAKGCAKLIDNPECAHEPEETTCEVVDVDSGGESSCLVERHQFECPLHYDTLEVTTNKEQTEIVCGSPTDCFNGECAKIEQETNDDFLEASMVAEMINDAKGGSSCSFTTNLDLENDTCRMFSGEGGGCTIANTGADSCCDPNTFGYGTIDVLNWINLYRATNEFAEKKWGVTLQDWVIDAVDVESFNEPGSILGDAFTSSKSFISEQFGSAQQMLNEGFDDVKTLFSQPGSSGIENTLGSQGISAKGSAVQSAMTPETITSGPIVVVEPSDPEKMQNMFKSFETSLASGINNITVDLLGDFVTDFTASSAEIVSSVATDLQQRMSNGSIGAMTYITQTIYLAMYEFTYALFGETFANAIFQTVSLDAAGAVITDGSEGVATELALSDGLTATLEFINLAMLLYAIYDIINKLQFACDEEDMETTRAVSAKSTTYVGEYCKRRIFGMCAQIKKMYCVYPSVFTRIIAEQIKTQIRQRDGLTFKEQYISETPVGNDMELKCNGFSMEQLDDIDMSAIDMTEYTEYLVAAMRFNDPSRVPEDMDKSNNGELDAKGGKEDGITMKGDATATAAILTAGADKVRDITLTNADIILDDPDFMPWVKGANGIAGTTCTMQCPDGFSENANGDCQRKFQTTTPAQKSCDTVNGWFPNEVNTFCEKPTPSALIEGCPNGLVIKVDVDGNTYYGDSIDALFTKTTDLDGNDVYTNLLGEILTAPEVGASDATAFIDLAGNTYNTTSTDYYCERTMTNNFNPSAQCPEGYAANVDRTECLLYDYEYRIPSCDHLGSDYAYVDDLCRKTVQEVKPAELTCDNDEYELNDGVCSRVTIIPYQITCDNEDDILDLETGTCYSTTTDFFPAEITCDHLTDYTLINGVCQQQDTQAILYVCDTHLGYTLQDGQCEKTITEVTDFGLTCPEGFKINSIRTACEAQVPEPTIEPTCPNGDLIDGLCHITTTNLEPAQFQCPDSYTYNSESELCEREIFTPPQFVCESGEYNTTTNNCVEHSTSSIAPTPDCGSTNWTLDPAFQLCFNDDKTASFPAKCDESNGFRLINDQCVKYTLGTIDCAGGELNSDDTQCVNAVLVDPICPHGGTWDQLLKTCVDVFQRPAKLKCPIGSFAANEPYYESCSGADYLPYVCNGTIVSNAGLDFCETPTTINVATCPQGYLKSPHGSPDVCYQPTGCESMDVVSGPSDTCFTLQNPCPVGKAYDEATGECLPRASSTPSCTDPMNYTFNEDLQSCVDITTADFRCTNILSSVDGVITCEQPPVSFEHLYFDPNGDKSHYILPTPLNFAASDSFNISTYALLRGMGNLTLLGSSSDFYNHITLTREADTEYLHVATANDTDYMIELPTASIRNNLHHTILVTKTPTSINVFIDGILAGTQTILDGDFTFNTALANRDAIISNHALSSITMMKNLIVYQGANPPIINMNFSVQSTESVITTPHGDINLADNTSEIYIGNYYKAALCPVGHVPSNDPLNYNQCEQIIPSGKYCLAGALNADLSRCLVPIDTPVAASHIDDICAGSFNPLTNTCTTINNLSALCGENQTADFSGAEGVCEGYLDAPYECNGTSFVWNVDSYCYDPVTHSNALDYTAFDSNKTLLTSSREKTHSNFKTSIMIPTGPIKIYNGEFDVYYEFENDVDADYANATSGGLFSVFNNNGNLSLIVRRGSMTSYGYSTLPYVGHYLVHVSSRHRPDVGGNVWPDITFKIYDAKSGALLYNVFNNNIFRDPNQYDDYFAIGSIVDTRDDVGAFDGTIHHFKLTVPTVNGPLAIYDFDRAGIDPTTGVWTNIANPGFNGQARIYDAGTSSFVDLTSGITTGNYTGEHFLDPAKNNAELMSIYSVTPPPCPSDYTHSDLPWLPNTCVKPADFEPQCTPDGILSADKKTCATPLGTVLSDALICDSPTAVYLGTLNACRDDQEFFPDCIEEDAIYVPGTNTCEVISYQSFYCNAPDTFLPTPLVQCQGPNIQQPALCPDGFNPSNNPETPYQCDSIDYGAHLCTVGSLVGSQCLEPSIFGIIPLGYVWDNDIGSSVAYIPKLADPLDLTGDCAAINASPYSTNECFKGYNHDCPIDHVYAPGIGQCESSITYPVACVESGFTYDPLLKQCIDPNTFLTDSFYCDTTTITFDGDVCQAEQLVGFTKSCSRGETYNPVTDLCERYEDDKHLPIKSCPLNDFVYSGPPLNICTNPSGVEVAASCPDNFVQEGDLCKKVDVGDKYCVLGDFNAARNVCVHRDQLPPICEKGVWLPIAATCGNLVPKIPEYECPASFLPYNAVQCYQPINPCSDQSATYDFLTRTCSIPIIEQPKCLDPSAIFDPVTKTCELISAIDYGCSDPSHTYSIVAGIPTCASPVYDSIPAICPEHATPHPTDPTKCELVDTQPILCNGVSVIYNEDSNSCVEIIGVDPQCEDSEYAWDATMATCIKVFPMPPDSCPIGSLDYSPTHCYNTSNHFCVEGVIAQQPDNSYQCEWFGESPTPPSCTDSNFSVVLDNDRCEYRHPSPLECDTLNGWSIDPANPTMCIKTTSTPIATGVTSVTPTTSSAPAWCETPTGYQMLSDFTADLGFSLGGVWTSSGAAFASSPASSQMSSKATAGGIGAVGTLTSPTFLINHDFIMANVSGNNYVKGAVNVDETLIRLYVGGVKIYEATAGTNNFTEKLHHIDLSAHVGQSAYIEVVDHRASHSYSWAGLYGVTSNNNASDKSAPGTTVLFDFDADAEGFTADASGILKYDSGLDMIRTDGDFNVGLLTSPTFTISDSYLHISSLGGNYIFYGQTYETTVNLVVGGNIVGTITGDGSTTAKQKTLDMRAYQGQTGYIQVIDDNPTNGWVSLHDIWLMPSAQRWTGEACLSMVIEGEGQCPVGYNKYQYDTSVSSAPDRCEAITTDYQPYSCGETRYFDFDFTSTTSGTTLIDTTINNHNIPLLGTADATSHWLQYPAFNALNFSGAGGSRLIYDLEAYYTDKLLTDPNAIVFEDFEGDLSKWTRLNTGDTYLSSTDSNTAYPDGHTSAVLSTATQDISGNVITTNQVELQSIPFTVSRDYIYFRKAGDQHVFIKSLGGVTITHVVGGNEMEFRKVDVSDFIGQQLVILVLDNDPSKYVTLDDIIFSDLNLGNQNFTISATYFADDVITPDEALFSGPYAVNRSGDYLSTFKKISSSEKRFYDASDPNTHVSWAGLRTIVINQIVDASGNFDFEVTVTNPEDGEQLGYKYVNWNQSVNSYMMQTPIYVGKSADERSAVGLFKDYLVDFTFEVPELGKIIDLNNTGPVGDIWANDGDLTNWVTEWTASSSMESNYVQVGGNQGLNLGTNDDTIKALSPHVIDFDSSGYFEFEITFRIANSVDFQDMVKIPNAIHTLQSGSNFQVSVLGTPYSLPELALNRDHTLKIYSADTNFVIELNGQVVVTPVKPIVQFNTQLEMHSGQIQATSFWLGRAAASDLRYGKCESIDGIEFTSSLCDDPAYTIRSLYYAGPKMCSLTPSIDPICPEGQTYLGFDGGYERGCYNIEVVQNPDDGVECPEGTYYDATNNLCMRYETITHGCYLSNAFGIDFQMLRQPYASHCSGVSVDTFPIECSSSGHVFDTNLLNCVDPANPSITSSLRCDGSHTGQFNHSQGTCNRTAGFVSNGCPTARGFDNSSLIAATCDRVTVDSAPTTISQPPWCTGLWRDGLCIIENMSTGDCPSGATLLNGVCIASDTDLPPYCGIDTHIGGAICQAVNTATYPAYSCTGPTNAIIGSLTSGSCTHSTSDLLTCPLGSSPTGSGDECVEFTVLPDPTITQPCLAGQFLKNGECVALSTQSKQCSSEVGVTRLHSQTNSNTCLVVQQSSLTCPVGFTYSSELRKCLNSATAAAVDNVICDVLDPSIGQSRPDLSTGTCEFVYEEPAVCPNDTFALNGACIEITTASITPGDCAGIIDTVTNECITESSYVPECPLGSSPSLTNPLQCDTLEISPIYCPMGNYSVTENKCMAQQTANVQCDDPTFTYDHAKGTCIDIFVMPSATCPDGSLQLNDLQCYYTTGFNCDHVSGIFNETTLQCEYQIPSAQIPSCIDPTYTPILANDQCEKIGPVNYECVHGYQLQYVPSLQCVEIIPSTYTEYPAFCTLPYVDSARADYPQQCLFIQPVSQYCETGNLNADGDCEYYPITNCPIGTIWEGNLNTCVKLAVKTKIPFGEDSNRCPVGTSHYDLDMCYEDVVTPNCEAYNSTGTTPVSFSDTPFIASGDLRTYETGTRASINGKTIVNVMADGVVIYTATGRGVSDPLTPLIHHIDLTPYIGQQLEVEMIDQNNNPWGWIGLSDITVDNAPGAQIGKLGGDGLRNDFISKNGVVNFSSVIGDDLYWIPLSAVSSGTTSPSDMFAVFTHPNNELGHEHMTRWSLGTWMVAQIDGLAPHLSLSVIGNNKTTELADLSRNTFEVWVEDTLIDAYSSTGINVAHPTDFTPIDGFIYQGREVQYRVTTNGYVDGYNYNPAIQQCEKITNKAPACTQSFMAYNELTERCEYELFEPLNCAEAAGEIRGDKCITIIEDVANKACPEGTTHDLILDKCYTDTIKTKEFIRTCATGNYLFEGECVASDNIAIVGTCLDPSYSFNRETRNCEFFDLQEQSPEHHCAVGSPEFNAGECTETFVRQPQILCDVGVYDEDLGQCVEFIETELPADTRCEEFGDAFYFDDNLQLCIEDIVRDGLECPPNFVFDIAADKCTADWVTDSFFTCPLGMAFDGVQCRGLTHEDVVCLDPNTQYDPISRQCQGIEVDSVQFGCPEGFLDQGDGTCLSQFTMQPQCYAYGSDFVYSNTLKKCIPNIERVSVVYSCNDDEVLQDGVCVSSITAPPTCATGTDLLNGRCVETLPSTEQYCPAGTLASGQCEQYETTIPVCSDTTYTYDETSNLCIKNFNQPVSYYCNRADDQYAFKNDLSCDIFQVWPITSAICDIDPLIHPDNDNACLAFMATIPASPECEDNEDNSWSFLLPGTDIPSNTCTKQLTAPPSCPIDELKPYALNTDVCDRTNVEPSLIRCLIDGVYRFGTDCGDAQEFAIECPINHFYSQDYHTCMQTITRPIDYTCPEHYAEDIATSELAIKCLRNAQFTPLCEADWTFNPTTNMCSHDLGTPPCDTADNYFYDSHLNTCVQENDTPAATSCLPGQIEMPDGCRIPTAPSCPVNFEYIPSEDQCRSIDTLSYEPPCNLPYTAISDTQCAITATAQCLTPDFTLDPHADVCIPTNTWCQHNYGNGADDTFWVYDNTTNSCTMNISRSVVKDVCPLGTVDSTIGCRPTLPSVCLGATDSSGICIVIETPPAIQIPCAEHDTGSDCRTLGSTNPDCTSSPTGATCEVDTVTTLTDDDLVCLSGTWLDGACRNTADTNPSCLSGTINSGTGECDVISTTILTASDLECPNGDWLDGACRNTTTEISGCLPGSIDNGAGTCLVDSIVTLTEADLECSSGTWLDGACRNTADTNPSCLSGSINPSTGECNVIETNTLTTADLECSSGTWLDGACRNTTAEISGCLAGSIDNGAGTCLVDSIVTLSSSDLECPSGTWLDGACRNTADTNPSCLSGTINSGTGECDVNSTTTLTSADLECPSGTWLDGACRNTADTNPSCLAGTINPSTGACDINAVITLGASDLTCPAGKTLDAGLCRDPIPLRVDRYYCDRTDAWYNTSALANSACAGVASAPVTTNERLVDSATNGCNSPWGVYGSDKCRQSTAKTCPSGYPTPNSISATTCFYNAAYPSNYSYLSGVSCTPSTFGSYFCSGSKLKNCPSGWLDDGSGACYKEINDACGSLGRSASNKCLVFETYYVCTATGVEYSTSTAAEAACVVPDNGTVTYEVCPSGAYASGPLCLSNTGSAQQYNCDGALQTSTTCNIVSASQACTNSSYPWNAALGTCATNSLGDRQYNCLGSLQVSNVCNIIGTDNACTTPGYSWNAALGTCATGSVAARQYNCLGTLQVSDQCAVAGVQSLCNSPYFWNSTLASCATETLGDRQFNCDGTLQISDQCNLVVPDIACTTPGYSWSSVLGTCATGSIVERQYNCLGTLQVSDQCVVAGVQPLCSGAYSWNSSLSTCATNSLGDRQYNCLGTLQVSNVCEIVQTDNACTTPGYAWNSALNTCATGSLGDRQYNCAGTPQTSPICVITGMQPSCTGDYFWDAGIDACLSSTPTAYQYECTDKDGNTFANGGSTSCSFTYLEGDACPTDYTWNNALGLCLGATGPYSYSCTEQYGHSASSYVRIINDGGAADTCNLTQTINSVGTAIPSCAHLASSTYNGTYNECRTAYVDKNADCAIGYEVEDATTCRSSTRNDDVCHGQSNVYFVGGGADICLSNTLLSFQYDCTGTGIDDPLNPGVCVNDTSVPTTCTDYGANYILDEGMDLCRPSLNIAQVPLCLDGKELISGECRLALSSPASCLSGNVEPNLESSSVLADRCSLEDTAGLTLDCPGSFVLDGTTCLSTYEIDRSLTCFDYETFNFLTGTCDSQNKQPPTPTCATVGDGTGVLMADGLTCLQTATSLTPIDGYECAHLGAGYTVNADNLCEIEITEDGYYECLDPEFTLILREPPLDPVCQKSTALTQIPNFVCPDTHPIDEGKGICKNETTSAPIYRCPLGYNPSVDGLTCEKITRKYVPFEYTCLSDLFTPISNRCYYETETDVDISCQDSTYTLELGFCVKRELIATSTPTLSCSGVIQSDGTCLANAAYPSQMTCPTGTTLDSFANTCISESASVSTPTIGCELPFIEVDGQCSLIITSEAQFGCQSKAWTFDPIGNSCTMIIKDIKIPSLCEPEHTQVGQQCFSTNVHALLPGCTLPYVVDPTEMFCEKNTIDIQQPKASCAEGYRRVDEICFIEDTQDPNISCDNDSGTPVTGYKHINGYCFNDTKATTTSTISCPETHTDINTGCELTLTGTSSLSCDNRDWIFDTETETCTDERIYQQSPLNLCPESHPENAQGSCELLMDSVALEYICTTGSFVDGACLESQLLVYPSGHCLAPSVRDGLQCLTYERIPLNYECPSPIGDERTWQAGNTCVTESISNAMHVEVCP